MTEAWDRCMHDGYTADDAWIMVEDEFLQTARLYTQHLHHAEYQRLKTQAKKASAIQSLVRPITNPERMSSAKRKALDAAVLSRDQDEVLDAICENDGQSAVRSDPSDDDEPFVADSHLAGLMMRPARTAQKLAMLTSASSNTRAAAGFNKSTFSSLTQDPVLHQATTRRYKQVVIAEESLAAPAHDEPPDDLASPSQPIINTTPRKFQRHNSGLGENSQQGKDSSSNKLLSSSRKSSRICVKQQNSSTRVMQLANKYPSEQKLDILPLSTVSSGISTNSAGQQRQESSGSLQLTERREARKRRLEKKRLSEPTQLQEVPTFLV